ncbi:MAG: hypothetical protein QOE22_595 [Candidatus Parcubacteria bacterium]|nr:hypothetical protein [Candidatus Parcubacteria bacterium]
MEHALGRLPADSGKGEALPARLETALRELRERLLARYPRQFTREEAVPEDLVEDEEDDDTMESDDGPTALPEEREMVVLEAEEILEDRMKRFAGLMAMLAPGLLFTNLLVRLTQGGPDSSQLGALFNMGTVGGAAVATILAVTNMMKADRVYETIDPNDPDDIARLSAKI